MSTLQDVRYGLRLLRKNPGFTAIAVAALALGVGANTAIFSIVNAILIRPLPYPGAERIGLLWENSPAQGWARQDTSGPNYVDYKRRTQSFEDLALMDVGSGTVSGLGEPMQVPGLRVTNNFLSMLGQKPLMGRDFNPDEGWENRVVILSYAAWMRSFGGDPSVLGRRVMADGLPYTVIGVTRPDLWLPVPSDVFVPWKDSDLERMGRTDHNQVAIVRLKPGISFRQASDDANAVLQNIARTYPRLQGWVASVQPMQEGLVEGVRSGLLVLLGAVGLVLLIACTNIANLLLARATGRMRETAIRTALGAGRARLIRQWLTETMVLGIAGGALGLLLAMWGVDLLDRVVPPTLRLAESSAEVLRPRLVIDGRVLGFTLLVSLLTGLVFGMAPALAAARPDAAEALKEGGRNSSSRRGRRLRDVFVVVEVALALMLLICAGLTIRSFWNLRQVNPGFSARNVLVMETELPTDSRYQKDPEMAQFFERVLAGIAALPGVRSAAVTSAGPIDQRDQKVSFSIEGRPLPNDHPFPAYYGCVSEDYFVTMGIPLLRGRAFTPQDRPGNPLVAVIDETLAQRYWPAGTPGATDPIGQRLRLGRTVVQVVGIVGGVRANGLVREPEPMLYTSYRQYPQNHLSILVRHPHPASAVNEVKRAIYAVDREQPVFNVRTMDALMQDWRSSARFTFVALLVFAGVAVLLAAIGIYGVISYSVAQRRGELGIRIALGASVRDVLGLVVGQGMVLASLGVVLGLAGAAVASRLLSSILFGVSATDPAIFAGTAALLAVVALAASWLPARRAARIDPIASLRYE